MGDEGRYSLEAKPVEECCEGWWLVAFLDIISLENEGHKSSSKKEGNERMSTVRLRPSGAFSMNSLASSRASLLSCCFDCAPSQT